MTQAFGLPELLKIVKQLPTGKNRAAKRYEHALGPEGCANAISSPKELGIVIRALGKKSLWQAALVLLPVVRSRAVEPDLIAYNVCISVCEKAGSWTEAFKVLSEMKKDQVLPDEISYNTLISACGRAFRWDHSLAVFAEVWQSMTPSTYSLNSVIGACERAGVWAISLALLNRGRYFHIQADVISFTSAINACSPTGSWTVATELMKEMLLSKVEANVVSHTALIRTLAVCQWQRALGHLFIMRSCSVALNRITINIVLRSLGSNWQLALRLLQYEDRIRPQADTYAAVLSVCQASACWVRALDLLKDAKARQISADKFMLNAAMGACDKAREWAHALQLLHQATEAVVLPDKIMYTTAIGACEKQWEHALTLYRQGAPDAISCAVMLSACEKCQKWAVAVGLFNEALDRGLRLDVTAYSAAISACGGQWTLALHIFAKMCSGLQPDTYAFNAVASSCTGRRWHLSLILFDLMTEQSLRPNVNTYGVVLSACASGALWQAAISYLQAASRGGVADATTYASTVDACESGNQAIQAPDFMEALTLKSLDSLQSVATTAI